MSALHWSLRRTYVAREDREGRLTRPKVYGGHVGASYTTTVYATTSLTKPIVTATTTSLATTTVSNGGACRSFSGACVVYGSSGAISTTHKSRSTTSSSSTSTTGPSSTGNGNGYIGPKTADGSGSGFISHASRSPRVSKMTAICLIAALLPYMLALPALD